MIQKQDLFAQISEKMQNNRVLCPLIFDDKEQAYDYIRSGVLNLAEFYITQVRKALVNQQVQDIVLIGGITSYIYNNG